MDQTFKEWCHNATEKFLQTVIIIDDGLRFNTDGDTSVPKKASRLSGSLLAVDDSKKQAVSSPPFFPEPDTINPLNALDLTNAFFHKGIVAGLFKPTSEFKDHSIIEASVAVAMKCDVVIIDWNLKNPGKTGASKDGQGVEDGGHLATRIIVGLVSDDYQNGGRLRTIIVYTAEKDLIELRNELIDSLSREEIKNSLTDNPIKFERMDDFSIVSPNLKVAFYSKPSGTTMDTGRKKSESELPGVVIEEFSSHANGLLPAFALSSTAAIRRNTHHLLTRFSNDLDCAYLAHRGMIPDPEDAEPYMLENLVSVIRNTLSLEQVDREYLGERPISLWTDQALNGGKTFTGKCHDKDVTFSPVELKEVFLGGTEKLKELIKEKAGCDSKNIDFDKAFAEAGKLLESGMSSENGLKRFSVLSSFKRSHEDIGWASSNNKPYLTQGTIIFFKSSGDKEKYLLCITPKCDCVRIRIGNGGQTWLQTPRKFSFVELKKKRKTEPHDLIINMNGTYIHLATKDKFHELIDISFESDSSSFRVESVLNSSPKQFKFRDVDSKDYQWVGDLKDLHIQDRVSTLVGNLNRVGLDEFEWLRIMKNGERKKK